MCWPSPRCSAGSSRTCAATLGYDLQYFAAIEPQPRLAPHVHLAIRGAVSRVGLRRVLAATYHQVWPGPVRGPDPRRHRPDQITRRTARHRLPAPLALLLQAHKAKQEAERTAPASCGMTKMGIRQPGRPPAQPEYRLPRVEGALLSEAGVHDGRLHDARHTAATVLAILAVPTPTAMAIMGWSSAAMAPGISTCSVPSSRAWPGRSAGCFGATRRATRPPSTPGITKGLRNVK